MTRSDDPPDPIPGQMEVEEVIALSEQEDGPVEPVEGKEPRKLSPSEVVARKLKGALPND